MGKTKIKELEETIVTPAEEQVDSVILGIPSLSKEKDLSKFLEPE